MPKPKIITGIDIGTGAIKILVAQKEKKQNFLKLVETKSFYSLGIRKGEVYDPNEVAKNLRNEIFEMSQKIGQKIDSVVISINGPRLKFISSQGVVSVSRADQKISNDDIERVIKEAQVINLPSNFEVLDIYSEEFIVDGQSTFKEPIGLSGVRLELKAGLVTVFSPALKNLTQAVLETGCQIENIVPSVIACSKSTLTPQEKELGVLLIEIGAATTGLAVYEEGKLTHLAILPIGSNNITNDIAIGLRTKIDIAEKIKKQFGFCPSKKKKRKNKKIEITEEIPFSFNQSFLAQIIKERVKEIFDLVQKELKKTSKYQMLPAGVVLTGGGASLKNIQEMAKEVLKLPARIGFPQGIVGIKNDLSFACAVGLLLEEEEEKEEERLEGFGSKIKKLFKIFIP